MQTQSSFPDPNEFPRVRKTQEAICPSVFVTAVDFFFFLISGSGCNCKFSENVRKNENILISLLSGDERVGEVTKILGKSIRAIF